MFRRRQPDPPVNVHLVLPGGGTKPLDCVYIGKDAQGIHNWRVLAPADGIPPFERISVDKFPARTGLVFDEQFASVFREKG